MVPLLLIFFNLIQNNVIDFINKLNLQNIFAKLSSNRQFNWNWTEFQFNWNWTELYVWFLYNICRSNWGEIKTVFKKFEVVFQPGNFDVVFQNLIILNSFQSKMLLYNINRYSLTDIKTDFTNLRSSSNLKILNSNSKISFFKNSF